MARGLEMNKASKFFKGQSLKARFIGDSNSFIYAKVIRRTTNNIWINLDSEGVKRCKVYIYDNVEYILPLDKYSMAPRFKAA